MDETALAVLVFNPQSDNPFDGLGQWDHALSRTARLPFRKLLVAGRCDRGGLTVSREGIDHFRAERQFAAYLETSARTGAGCAELREAVIAHIPWDDTAYTSSPRIFKLLKEAILRLKDEGVALLRMAELKQRMEMALAEERFTLEDLRAVVRLLAGQGVVWKLEFGDLVLLQPDRINAYAAAVVRSVRAHTDEIGCIPEEDVLAGKLDYQDMKRLPREEERVVLRAMHQIFVERGLCLREPADRGVLLVFPSYFKRQRPALATYQFRGPLEEIYATLIVRLYHTPTFEKPELWRFAADFRTPQGKRVGLKMTKKGEGAAEIDVCIDADVPDDTKVTFVRYVHDHLMAKDPDVTRVRHYACPHCQEPCRDRDLIRKRAERGLTDLVCGLCETRIPLFDLIEQKFASDKVQLTE